MVLTPVFSPGSAAVAGSSGVPGVVLVDLNGTPVSSGGSATVSIAAGTTANTVVKAAPGRLCRMLIAVSGTAAVTIYDNASAASGTVIGAAPASAAVGTSYDFEMPASLGITVAGNAALPGITVSYY